MDECKPLPVAAQRQAECLAQPEHLKQKARGVLTQAAAACAQGLTLAHFRAQVENLKGHIAHIRAQLEHPRDKSTG